jgi:hypothetical protein
MYYRFSLNVKGISCASLYSYKVTIEVKNEEIANSTPTWNRGLQDFQRDDSGTEKAPALYQ